jgi:hypothetical protein
MGQCLPLGDYVGRFRWTPDKAVRFGVSTRWRPGGHTHYFSNDAVALAVEIARVVTGCPSRPRISTGSPP